jgi:hypothetical protein
LESTNLGEIMYAEIKAKSDTESSRGKATCLNTGQRELALELKTSSPEHLGKPAWYLQLSARGYREQGTGERGGDVRGIEYSLELHLTPTEVAAIATFAHEKGLIATPGTTVKSPKRAK